MRTRTPRDARHLEARPVEKAFGVLGRFVVATVAGLAYGVIGWLAGFIFVALALSRSIEKKQAALESMMTGGRMGFILCAMIGFMLAYRRTWASEDRRQAR